MTENKFPTTKSSLTSYGVDLAKNYIEEYLNEYCIENLRDIKSDENALFNKMYNLIEKVRKHTKEELTYEEAEAYIKTHKDTEEYDEYYNIDKQRDDNDAQRRKQKAERRLCERLIEYDLLKNQNTTNSNNEIDVK